MPDCRVCGGSLDLVLNLGLMPLVDELADTQDAALAAARYPLELMRCQDCAWVQLSQAPPPQALFTSRYPYYSSVSDSVCQSARHHAEQLIGDRQLSSDSLVVEVASNDGYQLQWFQQSGVPVLGIDPADGPAAAARERGIDTLTSFFDLSLARDLKANGQQANVIIGKNVLAHVPDPNDFVAGVATLLAADGIVSFEFPYLANLLKFGQFDTIYHEHISYLAITPLAALLRRHGLYINAITEVDLHGGSVRVDATRSATKASDVTRYLEMEAVYRINELQTLTDFADRVDRQVSGVRETVFDLLGNGHRLAAYGAAAKGAVLLNACQLDGEQLEFVVDRSPHKVGLFMPGVGLPIRPVTQLLEEQPDVTLLLAWNFIDEVRAQQQQYEQRGGRWLLPIPAARLV